MTPASLLRCETVVGCLYGSKTEISNVSQALKANGGKPNGKRADTVTCRLNIQV